MLLWLSAANSICCAQSAPGSIVLHDLTLIENAKISSLNVDGVVLDGGLRYSWADILQGDVGDQQLEFDSALKNIGMPLFRIKARLRNGSYSELQSLTDDLLAQVGESQGRTAYIAWAAAFHSRLESGQRTQAVLPLTRLLAIRETAGDLSELDQSLNLRFSDDGICMDLLPVWFDKNPIADVLASLPEDLNSEAAAIYRQSLRAEIFSNQNDSNDATTGSNLARESVWSPLLSAQSSMFDKNYAKAIETLNKSAPFPNPAQRAIALYYLGLAKRNQIKQLVADDSNSEPSVSTSNAGNDWKLDLLQIPATWSDRFPELAAAAISQVLDDPESVSPRFDSLRDELVNRFANTFHGRRQKAIRNNE